MHPSEIRAVVADLRSLVGSPLRNVWVPTRDTVVLRLQRSDLMVVCGQHGRIHLTEARPPNPLKPFSFQGLLRARLRGRLDAITQLHDDRVVELQFGDHRLHARLFSGGGIWLCDGERVLGAIDGPAPASLPPLVAANGLADPPPRFSLDAAASAAGAWFEPRIDAIEVDELQRSARQALHKRLKQTRRLISGLEGDLERAGNAGQLREDADCLAASLHRVPRGAEQVDVPDLYAHGQVRTLSLDPSRSPADNLNRMYSKSKRLDAAVDHVLRRLDAAEEQLRQLQAALDDVDTATPPELRALLQRWHRPQRSRDRTAPDPWWTWHGPGGAVIRVGRNARGNHRLTFRESRGSDQWFHLRDRPGAHVVLQMPDRGSPDAAAVSAALELVLQTARIPAGAAHDVQSARVGSLRPMPDRQQGGVIVHDEVVHHVRREPNALEGWQQVDGDAAATKRR